MSDGHVSKRTYEDLERLKNAKRTHYTHFEQPHLPWHACVICKEPGMRVVEGEWYCLDHYLTRRWENDHDDNS